jgi:hypothetical protein
MKKCVKYNCCNYRVNGRLCKEHYDKYIEERKKYRSTFYTQAGKFKRV